MGRRAGRQHRPYTAIIFITLVVDSSKFRAPAKYSMSVAIAIVRNLQLKSRNLEDGIQGIQAQNLRNLDMKQETNV